MLSSEDRASQLARAYQAGARGGLAELYALVRPTFAGALARAVQRGRFAGGLEPRDLEQQSWVIVAELALRWQPALGAFGAYVRVAFPFELERYLRRFSPARHSRHVSVVSVEHERAVADADLQEGTNGRAWDDQLFCRELLDRLPPPERRALLLRERDGLAFAAIARALELPDRTAAFRLYRRAIRRLRTE